jgi:hypothetical protein
MNNNYRTKAIVFILSLFLFFIPYYATTADGKIKIDKGYLKYNREKAIQYAGNWWHSINISEGYKDYRNFGGDCANFVSQILIAGGLRDLIKGIDPNIVGIGNTIKGAQQLSSDTGSRYPSRLGSR